MMFQKAPILVRLAAEAAQDMAARPEPSPVQAVKLISRNAVIVAAVRGYGYCRSAARAAQLLLGNAVTLATVTSTAYVLLLVGRLAVAAATTAVVWATLASNPLASPDVALLRIVERCAFCILYPTPFSCCRRWCARAEARLLRGCRRAFPEVFPRAGGWQSARCDARAHGAGRVAGVASGGQHALDCDRIHADMLPRRLRERQRARPTRGIGRVQILSNPSGGLKGD
jgi:hypothetical protein